MDFFTENKVYRRGKERIEKLKVKENMESLQQRIKLIWLGIWKGIKVDVSLNFEQKDKVEAGQEMKITPIHMTSTVRRNAIIKAIDRHAKRHNKKQPQCGYSLIKLGREQLLTSTQRAWVGS